MRDGTVITAESYRLTGSYIMLKLGDGRQVAYDVADVDLDALRAAEAAAAGPQGESNRRRSGAPARFRVAALSRTRRLVGEDDRLESQDHRPRRQAHSRQRRSW